mgnify:CR=1 FL=1
MYGYDSTNRNLVDYANGKIVYARKRQDKIFELLVDSVDAIIPEDRLRKFENQQTPAHPKQWEKIILSLPEGRYKDGCLLYDGGWRLWKVGGGVTDTRTFPCGEGEYLVSLRISRIKDEDNFSGHQGEGRAAIELWYKLPNGIINKEATNIRCHRDGTVKVSKSNCERIIEMLAHFGLEIVEDERDITAMDWWYTQWYKLLEKFKPSPEEAQKVLASLYAQGWNQFTPTPPQKTLYLPCKCGEVGLEDVALVKVEIFNQSDWAKVKNIQLVSLKGGAASVLGENLPLEYDEKLDRITYAALVTNQAWEIVGYGGTREECDRIHEKLLKMQKISGTSPFLIAKAYSAVNAIGRYE